jgi:hypothetical protein
MMTAINRRSLQALFRTAPIQHVCTRSTKIAEVTGEGQVTRRVLFHNTYEGDFCGYTEVHYRKAWKTEEPFHTIGYGKIFEDQALEKFKRQP